MSALQLMSHHLAVHLPLNREQDHRTLKLLHLGQQLTLNLERQKPVSHPFSNVAFLCLLESYGAHFDQLRLHTKYFIMDNMSDFADML